MRIVDAEATNEPNLQWSWKFEFCKLAKALTLMSFELIHEQRIFLVHRAKLLTKLKWISVEFFWFDRFLYIEETYRALISLLYFVFVWHTVCADSQQGVFFQLNDLNEINCELEV